MMIEQRLLLADRSRGCEGVRGVDYRSRNRRSAANEGRPAGEGALIARGRGGTVFTYEPDELTALTVAGGHNSWDPQETM